VAKRNRVLIDELIGQPEPKGWQAGDLMADGVISYYAPSGDLHTARAMKRISRRTGLPVERWRDLDGPIPDIVVDYQWLPTGIWGYAEAVSHRGQDYRSIVVDDTQTRTRNLTRMAVEHELGHAFGLEHVDTGLLGGRSVMDGHSGPQRMTKFDVAAIEVQFEAFL